MVWDHNNTHEQNLRWRLEKQPDIYAEIIIFPVDGKNCFCDKCIRNCVLMERRNVIIDHN